MRILKLVAPCLLTVAVSGCASIAMTLSCGDEETVYIRSAAGTELLAEHRITRLGLEVSSLE